MSHTDQSSTAEPVAAADAPPLKGGVIPYLMVDGAAAAIDFYKRALDAEEIGERASTDDGRILNSRVDISGSSIMLMDPMPERGYPAATHEGFNLNLQVDDADQWFNRAVAAGCTVVVPMELQFWGDRYGFIRDPFGIAWAFASTPA